MECINELYAWALAAYAAWANKHTYGLSGCRLELFRCQPVHTRSCHLVYSGKSLQPGVGVDDAIAAFPKHVRRRLLARAQDCCTRFVGQLTCPADNAALWAGQIVCNSPNCLQTGGLERGRMAGVSTAVRGIRVVSAPAQTRVENKAYLYIVKGKSSRVTILIQLIELIIGFRCSLLHHPSPPFKHHADGNRKIFQ